MESIHSTFFITWLRVINHYEAVCAEFGQKRSLDSERHISDRVSGVYFTRFCMLDWPSLQYENLGATQKL